MKTKPIDGNLGTPVLWDGIFTCRLAVRRLHDLRTVTRRIDGILQHVELNDEDGQFKISFAVAAVIPQDDGTIEVYGGAGTDENYGTWCFVLPANLYQLREGSISTIAYYCKGAMQISLSVEC